MNCTKFLLVLSSAILSSFVFVCSLSLSIYIYSIHHLHLWDGIDSNCHSLQSPIMLAFSFVQTQRSLYYSASLGILPMMPCSLAMSTCQTAWWLWAVPLASGISEDLISNHRRRRRDGKTMTRTMRQTGACSLFVRIQHGRRRSEALFPSVDSVLDSLEPKLILQ